MSSGRALGLVAQEVRIFLSSVWSFSRIPVPQWISKDPHPPRSSVTRYFPAIGILMGAVSAACLWVGASILPMTLAVLLSTAATAALSGAVHEDGLADTFDGLGGGRTGERILEIMKDSRIGSFGAVALLLVLAAKIVALSHLSVREAVVGLICAHALSRWCSVLLVWRLRYVRVDESSRARPMVASFSLTDLIVASVSGLLPIPLCGIAGAWGFTAAVLTVLLMGSWFRRRVGGYTGDMLGAAQQCTEAVYYLVLVAVWHPS